MPEHLARARKYRARADELKKLAATLEEEHLRAKLMAAADEYAAMAATERKKSTVRNAQTPD